MEGDLYVSLCRVSDRWIRRKVKAALLPKQRSPTAMQLSVEAFVQRFQGIDAIVCVTDAHVSGACDYGIRAWRCAVGIDYYDREVSLERVLQGFLARLRTRPLTHYLP